MDELTEAAWITYVQAQRLDKPYRPTTLKLIEATMLDTGKHSSTLGGLKKLVTLYLSRLLPQTLDRLLQHGTSFLDVG